MPFHYSFSFSSHSTFPFDLKRFYFTQLFPFRPSFPAIASRGNKHTINGKYKARGISFKKEALPWTIPSFLSIFFKYQTQTCISLQLCFPYSYVIYSYWWPKEMESTRQSSVSIEKSRKCSLVQLELRPNKMSAVFDCPLLPLTRERVRAAISKKGNSPSSTFSRFRCTSRVRFTANRYSKLENQSSKHQKVILREKVNSESCKSEPQPSSLVIVKIGGK